MPESTDERGRIQLPEDVRERYGERYHVVELPSHVALFPIDDDPLEGLREAVGDAFEDLDSDDVKARALKTASRLAEERADRRTPRRSDVYVEADFLTALVKDDDWLQEQALAALQDRDDLETSILAAAEVLVVLYDRDDAVYDVDAPRALATLVALVPIDPREHKAAVLATVDFLEDHDLTPFDAFHAGLVATREGRVLSTEQDYDELGLNRIPLAEEYGS